MLTIRREQLQILGRQTQMNQLVQHARTVAPDVCAQISAPHLDAIAEYCMNRCHHYGITRDYHMLLYLNLMLVYGVTFDREQTWAAGPLAFRNPEGRMELLMDHALRQIPETVDTRSNNESDA